MALSSNNSGVANPAVGSLVIPAGSTSAGFKIKTAPVSANTIVNIKATANVLSKSANLTVRAPRISSLTLVPNSVNSGGSSMGVVMLDGPAAPGGVSVNLTSNNTAAANPDVSSITIAEGDTYGFFNITANTVSAKTLVSIAATTSTNGKAATLTIYP